MKVNKVIASGKGEWAIYHWEWTYGIYLDFSWPSNGYKGICFIIIKLYIYLYIFLYVGILFHNKKMLK